MKRLSRVLMCLLAGILVWGAIQIGCAPKDPCRLCRSDELCNGTSCVKIKVPDGSVQDGVVADRGPTDTGGGDTASPIDKGPGCQGDNQCEFGTRCVDGKCISTQEPPPRNDGATKDGGGTDASMPDVPTPTDTTRPEKSGSDASGSEGTNPEQGGPDKPECTKDSDCRSTQECKAGKCVTKPPACDPACPTGATCTKGKCERAGSTPDLGELCGPNSKCKTGLTCLETDGSSSYCFQECKESKECANNPLGKACVGLTQTQRFCVEVVKLGDKCGFKEKLQALCPSQTLCSAGVCKKPQEVRRYDKCGVNAQVCPAKMICLRLGGTSHGYCVDPCTPSNPTCPDQGNCITLSGGGACLPSGTGAHDTLCGGTQTGSSLDRSKICKPGLECVQLSQPVCMEFWTGDCKTAGKTCPAGRTCQGLNGSGGQKFGACFANCKQDKCDQSHMECRKNFSNTCWPKSP